MDAIKSGPTESQDFTLLQIEQIFLKEGYRRLTVGELAHRLRCSKRKLYEYATSKEDLFLLILRNNLDLIWELGLQAEANADNPVKKIEDYMAACLVPIKSWSHSFLADIQSTPAAKHLLDEHLKQRMDHLLAMVEDGISTGKFRRFNAQVVAELILVTGSHFCSPEFLDRAGLSLTRAIEEMLEMVWGGLVRDGHESQLEGI